ncbi:MAG: glycerol-3-phosphate dehydrogenase/oxidase [Verrucomicrobia bacterium]|nr:glycerol-3-phosphate dehydrogenase/oxidase [Verrucomicrobiota bacterium]
MKRENAVQILQQSSAIWDVLIIGGGATGLGTAVDAAARGYRTLLLEQNDFAKATSSRSTKLIHGGFRYLKQGNVPLVRESLRERGLLLRNAPHLVRCRSFVVPGYQWWETPYYGMGLKVYDLLAGKLGLGPSQIISREETLKQLPTLEPRGLRGGVRYFDGQFDDARLAVCLAQTVFDHGGVALNYCKVTGLLKEGGRVCGVMARDTESGREFEVRARAVINATGIFTDDIRRMDDHAVAPVMTASQGAHLVLPKSFLPGDSALMVPKTADGRILFAIPWHGRVLVGTTDTPVTEISLEPKPFAEEIEFLLAESAKYLAKAPARSDILSASAGLRPLVKTGGGPTAKLARDHALFVSPAGLVTITGGKWTTYRKMAEDTVEKAIAVGGLEPRPCVTEGLRVHGAAGEDLRAAAELMSENPVWCEWLHPRLPSPVGEVIWAVRHEMARTVEDVLSRRTRALLLDARASREIAPRVAALLAAELGRDEQWRDAQVKEFSALAGNYLPQ